MGSLLTMMLKHPDEVYPLIKLKMAARNLKVEKQNNPHWEFCFTILQKVSLTSCLAIQQLPIKLRGPVCIFYLVLRALDTVEDDTSIPKEVKVPILLDFHRYIYDREWHFSCECTKKYYKVLMDNFHHLSSAFLELGKDYQEIIEEITMRMGRGMAKFIGKEVETMEDYDEYCHYAAGLVGIGLSRLFHTVCKEDLPSESLSNSMGRFLQKTNIIRDYLEDINEIPKCRMFWPREIWSKYVNKLEDLKDEEKSVKAVECLNEMITNALSHVEDCLAYLSIYRDPSILMFSAILQMMFMGSLVTCYNNIQVFKGVVQIRHGLTAKIIDRAKTMEDVYCVFYDFSCMLKSKVDIKDPNASKTLERLEKIMKTCRNSGALNNRKSYIVRSQPNYMTTPALVVVFFVVIILAIFLGYPFGN